MRRNNDAPLARSVQSRGDLSVENPIDGFDLFGVIRVAKAEQVVAEYVIGADAGDHAVDRGRKHGTTSVRDKISDFLAIPFQAG